MNSYTIKATHNDYNESLVGVIAENSSLALSMALEHYALNRAYLKPIVKLEVIVEDTAFTTEIKMHIFKTVFMQEAQHFAEYNTNFDACAALVQVLNDKAIIRAVHACTNETAVENVAEYAANHYIQ